MFVTARVDADVDVQRRHALYAIASNGSAKDADIAKKNRSRRCPAALIVDPSVNAASTPNPTLSASQGAMDRQRRLTFAGAASADGCVAGGARLPRARTND